jgi:hypothetical protein
MKVNIKVGYYCNKSTYEHIEMMVDAGIYRKTDIPI